MVEAVERKPHSRAQERGKIRRKLINRMRNGEVLIVTDFEDLLDMGSGVETLHRLTPQTSIGRYKGETLFFDTTAKQLDFESTTARIDEAEKPVKPQSTQTFGWNYQARFEGK